MNAAADRLVRLDDGTSLAVRDTGPAHGPALIWGHGLTSSMRSEDELGLLDWTTAAPGHRIVRYDARGHGSSASTERLEDYRWDRLAVDQLAVADASSIERYVAAGASMGCATALFAALAAPERVSALVLVIPPTAWDTRREQIGMYATMADLLDDGRTDVLLAGVEAAPTPDPFRDQPAWKQRARTTLRDTDPVRLARVFRGAGLADLPPEDRLATIEQPALILAWSGDPGHPVSTAERLDHLLPHSSLHVASTADELAEWSDRVDRFLRSIGNSVRDGGHAR